MISYTNGSKLNGAIATITFFPDTQRTRSFKLPEDVLNIFLLITPAKWRIHKNKAGQKKKQLNGKRKRQATVFQAEAQIGN